MDNLKVLAALKQKLKKCGSEWIEGFIDEDGVCRYVNSVVIFAEAKDIGFESAIFKASML